MYPSSEKPYAGVYVKNLYEGLCKLNEPEVHYHLLAMPRQYTSKIGSVIKYTKFLFGSLKYLFRKYQVVHIHFFYPLIIWGAVYKLFHPRSKLVVTCHGTDINGHFSGGLSQYFARSLSRSLDYLIAVGEELKKTAEQKLARTVDSVWPAGIDERTFYSSSQPEAKQYDFIFVGSFTVLKGVSELIAALKNIEEPLKLCFVGSGPLLSDIMTLSDKHDLTIKENLPQSEIAALYKQAKFLVLPSKSEAFGLVVSEAMYCGVPAIVSAVGGLKMQVEEGRNGFFFKGVTVSSIQERLEEAMLIFEGDYKRLAECARHSNKQFSLAKVVAEHKQLYRRLLDESKT